MADKRERNDSWSKDDDEVLAMTLIQTVKNGNTQLKAFEEVGNLMGRTSAAVGFRWNSVVRKNYKDALDEAKRIAKENRVKQKKEEVSTEEENNPNIKLPQGKGDSKLEESQEVREEKSEFELPFDVEALISFLHYIKDISAKGETLFEENQKLKIQLNELNELYQSTKSKLDETNQKIAAFARGYS